jgi:hypothetical protein
MTSSTTPTSTDPTVTNGTMKAVVHHTYGGPEVLRIADVPRPRI